MSETNSTSNSQICSNTCLYMNCFENANWVCFFFSVDDDSTDATSNSKTNKDLKNASTKRQIKRDFTKSGHMNRTFTKTMHETENVQESKIPVRIKTRKHDEDLHAKDETLDADFDDDKNEDDIFPTQAVRTGSLSALTSEMTIQGNTRRRTRTALVLAKRVRSSGYGVSVNPKLRPMALKPKSASRPSAPDQRETSAKSKGSSSVGVSVAALLRENSRPIVTGKEDQRWEIIPSTIDEETHRTKQDNDTENVRSSLEEEDPLSGRESGKPTTRLTNRETARSELVRIEEILREESTSSDLLDQSVIQERLSSIKRKVEYRRRGMDSRSSMGSEFDAFMDRYDHIVYLFYFNCILVFMWVTLFIGVMVSCFNNSRI